MVEVVWVCSDVLLEDELDSLIDDIASRVAVDFRARLRNPS